MMFKLEIDTTSEAFKEQGYPSFEVGRILLEFGQKLIDTGTPTMAGTLRDKSDKPVGKWSYNKD